MSSAVSLNIWYSFKRGHTAPYPFAFHLQGKMEGRRRRGRPSTNWFHDLKECTKLDIAGASPLATDRERWRKIIKSHSIADSATRLERERERAREKERERERESESERVRESERERERERVRESEREMERETERERE